MALFFDAPWFETKLEERGLSRAAMAAVAALSEADLELVFKDQRELSAGQVAAFAELLGVTAGEVVNRAGVSTPTPTPTPTPREPSGPASGQDARMLALERRIAALEAEVARLREPMGHRPPNLS